jgi:hypothetical protein
MARTARFLAAIVAGLLVPASAQAADRVYVGPGGGDWNVAANWSGGAVPGPADTAIVNGAAVAVHVSPNQAAGSVELRSARLSVAAGARLSVLSRLTLVTARLTGPGAIDVSPAGLVSTSGGLTLDGGVDLTLPLTTTWSSGDIEMSEHALVTSIVVPPAATLPLLDGGTLRSNTASDLARVVNVGTIVKSGAGTTTVQVPVLNAGTVDVRAGVLPGDLRQSAGQTVVAAGAKVVGSVTLNGGTLGGRGTISGDVANLGGTVSPGRAGENGLLAIDGDYKQMAGGTLEIDIAGRVAGSGGPTGHDVLAIAGDASLAGALALATDPSFRPQTSHLFTILTRAKGSGSFGAVTGTAVATGTYVTTYAPTAVTLGLLDTTPPAIDAKKEVVVESRLAPVTVRYTSPAATDAHDGSTPVTCEPPSGSKLDFGVTTVKCSSTDRSGNAATSQFDAIVQLPTTPGAVTAPGDPDEALSSVEQGERVRVDAGGFAPRSRIRLLFVTATGRQVRLAVVKAGWTGRFEVTVKVPRRAPLGASQMTAVGIRAGGGELVRAWLLTVTETRGRLR